MPFETHEAYFATLEPEVRERLERIQQEVERRVPGAQRCISYQMPAFRERREPKFTSSPSKDLPPFYPW